ncbi:hypothetical protein ACHAXS_009962 [Conticribra weissflogii]
MGNRQDPYTLAGISAYRYSPRLSSHQQRCISIRLGHFFEILDDPASIDHPRGRNHHRMRCFGIEQLGFWIDIIATTECTVVLDVLHSHCYSVNRKVKESFVRQTENAREFLIS